MFRPIQFGKYYLTERIAVGGMAEIFKAKLFGVSGFEKPMVVKQILPKHARNADFIRMFVDEAKIAVSLTHGNIVPVYELGRIDGIYFIAMEYVSGKDLAEILETARAQNCPLSLEHAIFIAIEICKGLDYAHRRTDVEGRHLRLVHRDISPPNVLVSMEGEIKITDFGIAKSSFKLGATEAGVVKGTFGYMSPEQVRGLPLDHRTDIFSAGILLHEMLTGRRLFVGDSDVEAIERVKIARIPAPSSINPRLPSAIDPIVFKALAKDASDRYADANELQLALSRFLFTSGTGATSSSLSRYMHELFAEEPPDASADTGPTELTAAAALLDGNATEAVSSFAVRSELQRVARSRLPHPSGPSRQRPSMDVGAGAAPLNATLALPSLAESAPALAELTDDEKTSVFRTPAPLPRPEVPKLRFPSPVPAPSNTFSVAEPTVAQTPSAKRGNRAVSEEAPAFPSTAELAALADDLEESSAGARPPAPSAPAPSPPSPLIAPAALVGSSSAREPAGDEPVDLMRLMTRPESGEHAPLLVGGNTGSQAPPPSAAAGERAPRRQKRVSGLVSSTMRLFVEGLDDEDRYPLYGTEGSSAQPALETGDYSGAEDVVPRTIKPTILGWILIALVMIGAGLFVLYKKTDLFSSAEPESEAVLDPQDLRQPAGKQKTEKRGRLVLVVRPDGASIYRFMGEAPVTLERLDRGQQHLLRVEREGYQTTFKVLEPTALAGEGPAIKVVLHPVGAGASEDQPPPTAGKATGQHLSLKVESDPPMAMVWLLVGQGGQIELPDIDTSRSHDFKVVLPGHQVGLIHVSSVDFADGESYTATVNLEPSTPSGAATIPAGKEPAAAGEVPAGKSPAATPPAGPAARVRATAPHPPRRKVPVVRRVKTAPAKKDKGRPGAGIQTPSWAK